VNPETTPLYRKGRSPARNKGQSARARELRRHGTESQEVAWRLLGALKLSGFKFCREHAVGRYIVDFCCPQRRLIVELDGSVHRQPSHCMRSLSDVYYRSAWLLGG
jgi:type I restriction enzyme R subunit